MPKPEFPSPSPATIDRFSPTLANQLLGCGLSAGFRLDPAFSEWRRPSEYSAIGSAAHAVTEAAFIRRDWPDDPSELRRSLEKVWDDKIGVEERKLKTAWNPATPPARADWPGFFLTRSRTIRRCERLIGARGDHEQHGTGRTQVEAELSDPETGLWGRADRIERRGGQTRVVDLKTGLRQGEPTEEQTRQLMLYAVLCHRVFEDWPTEVVIESASGAQRTMSLDPADAEATLEDVISAVNAFNHLVNAEEDLQALAKPSPEQCRWCEFRVVCGPYWHHLHEGWEHRAVLGEITGAGEVDQGGYVEVSIISPTDLAGESLNLASLAVLPLEGDRWAAATDFSGQVAAGSVRGRWSSRVRTWH
ncbi:PD-(D/E)XK nuclease family protein [Acidimicrobiales bacterium]|nr:PD-(D/E)XK nuclease family protein [Acidimicrobiales bacterium]